MPKRNEQGTNQKNNLKGLKSPCVITREPGNTGTREIKLNVRGETAARAIGKLKPGCEIYGFTKGQFSLIDVIDHLLNETGPAAVTIATWSAAAGDIKRAHQFLRNDKITELRFVVDFSFKSRKPEFCQKLIDTFGADCIRVTVIHAKFAIIKNDKWNLLIRTSMNLNYNPRFENFEISDSAELIEFMDAIVTEIWQSQDSYEGFEKRPYDIKNDFKDLYGGHGPETIADREILKTDLVNGINFL